MNIQNNPRQIALTNEQITGIKDRYTKEMGKIATNTPIVEQAQNTEQMESIIPEANIFDVELNQSFNQEPVSTPAIEEPVAPISVPIEEKTIFDNPIQEISTNEPTNSEFANVAPTNAELIGNSQNMFDIEPGETAPVIEEPIAPSEPIMNNNFFAPSTPEVSAIGQSNDLNENLASEFEQILNASAQLYGMIESFGKKLNSLGLTGQVQAQSQENQSIQL